MSGFIETLAAAMGFFVVIVAVLIIIAMLLASIAGLYFNHILPWRMSRHLRKGRKW